MNYKDIITLFLLLFISNAINASNSFRTCKGVWASDSAEAVITDSVCIFFEKKGSLMQAYIAIPSRDITRQTIFNDSTVTTTNISPLDISIDSNRLSIGNHTLSKVEEIETCTPYDMPSATSKFNIGDRLQEWRLGVHYEHDSNSVYCEINTNRHLFVYMVLPNMTYIRAAATRNNNNGTLFFQNIRMMKNKNTGEYTASIMQDNLAKAMHDLEIDNSKFKADACTFCPDGGIYWSFISYTPDRILLNGCGETYQIYRRTKGAKLEEWIKFKPYTNNRSSEVFSNTTK